MVKFSGADPAQFNSKAERNKLIGMSVMLVLLVGAFLFAQTREKDPVVDDNVLPQTTAQLQFPKFPAGTFDDELDAEAEDRVILDRARVEVVYGYVRRLTEAHIQELRPAALNAEVLTELEADAASRRGEVFSARGEIQSWNERRIDGRLREIEGLIRTQDGTPVYFMTERTEDETLGAGDWLALNGVFLKWFSAEDPALGERVDAPLVLASKVKRSFPDLGTVAEIPAEVLATVTDDTLDEKDGLPEKLRWEMLAWMRDMPAEQVDWEAAPELDALTLAGLLNGDSESSRGKAFRMPVSIIQGMTSLAQGENPARLDYVTEGWIGNYFWKDPAPVIKFIAPGNMERFQVGERVEAEVVFFKNVAYDTAQVGRRLAPLFAVRSLRAHTPEPAYDMRIVWGGFFSLAVGMIGFIWFSLSRQRKATEELQKKLVERRKARRERAATGAAS